MQRYALADFSINNNENKKCFHINRTVFNFENKLLFLRKIVILSEQKCKENNGAVKLVIKQDGNMQITTGGNTLTTENLNVNNGQWTHVAFSKDVANGKVALYINGTLFKEWTGLTLTATDAEKTAFTFGSDASGANYYTGYIGETRVWKTVRSATDIANNKAAYYNGQTTDLIALWRF